MAGANSITKMTITDRGAGHVSVTVTGKNGPLFLPIKSWNLPLTARVILGLVGGSAMLGDCGEVTFAATGCKQNPAGTPVMCKE